jgi:cell wall-associated NlpC family hydrolase
MIIAVGNEMGVNSHDIMTALVAAMQESGLRNLSYGDRDSLGLFQQRPSQGWGSAQQVMNPLYAAKKFFTSLEKVKGRDNLSFAQAAQAVQRSAFPAAYAKWENDARRLLNDTGGNGGLPWPVDRPTNDISLTGALGGPQTGAEQATAGTPGLATAGEDAAVPGATGAGATTGDLKAPTAESRTVDTSALDKMIGQTQGQITGSGTGQRATVINAAKRWLGTPYLWGGGNANGPTSGIGHGTNTVTGFDCSGLVLYALAQAGVKGLPHLARLQLGTGKNVGTNMAALQPGDLIGMEAGGHIGIYLGNGQFIEAPHTGANVRISKLSQRSGWWGVHLNLSGGFDSTAAASAAVPGLDAAAAQQPIESYPGL